MICKGLGILALVLTLTPNASFSGGPYPIPLGDSPSYDGAVIQDYLLWTEHNSIGLDVCYDGGYDGDGPSGDHGLSTAQFLEEAGTFSDPSVYLEDYGGTNGDWTVEWRLRSTPDELPGTDPWTYTQWDIDNVYPKTGCPFWSKSPSGQPQFSTLVPGGLLLIEIIDNNNQQYLKFVDLPSPNPGGVTSLLEWTFTTPQFPAGVASFDATLYLYGDRLWAYEWLNWDDDCNGITPRVCADYGPVVHWWYYHHLDLRATRLLPPS